MLQILLAADEKLQKAIVGPLEAKGCAVRVVRGLSEVVQACAQEPRPQVIAAALPVSAGGAQAIGELRASTRTKLPPLMILLPPNRGSEVPALKAAGAAEVFESPLKLNLFLQRAKELAATPTTAPAKPPPPKPAPKPAAKVEPAPPPPTQTAAEMAAESPVSALLKEELGEKTIPPPKAPVPAAPAGPPVWPRTVVALEACQYAIVSFNSTGETPAGFDKETLTALFRVMTDVEVRAVKDIAGGSTEPSADLFARVTAQRLRIRQAAIDGDRLIAGGAKAPIDDTGVAEWLKQLDALGSEVQPIHEKAVASGDLSGIRQYKLVIDALGRLRRDLENAAYRIQGRTDVASGALIDEDVEAAPEEAAPRAKPKVPKAPKGVKVLEMSTVSESEFSQGRRQQLMVVGLGVGLVLAVTYVVSQMNVFGSSYEYLHDIPGAQTVVYESKETVAHVSPDFDIQRWGYALSRQAKSQKPIRVMSISHETLGFIDGQTARDASGKEIKLDTTETGDPKPPEIQQQVQGNEARGGVDPENQ